ncbi:MAG: dihydrolipoamide acetyltransferase family protein [Janthinobacterium lividum]
MAERIIKLPDVGEGVAEAEVSEWHVAVGDAVREDQVLAAITTDKVTVEIPSPVAGTVTALGAAAGTILAVGAELLRIEVGGAAQAPAVAEPVETSATAAAEAEAPVAKIGAPVVDDKPMASPAVRRRAMEAGLDLRHVEGSGPGGRIRHFDIDRALQHAAPAPAEALAAAPAPARLEQAGGVQEIRLSGVRRAIATRMEATRRITHFSYIEEVDVTALEELRAALRGQGRKLSVLPFIALATARAVAAFPQMNALFDDEAGVIRRHAAVHLGIATQTPAGLTVPVLRDAGTLDLFACAAGIAAISAAARDGTATREAMAGSTITITSLGALGGLATTPVINRPEVAIIGVNKIVTRPMWRDGAVVPRQMMNLSSSFDHRVIDGVEAAEFVQGIKALLEVPALIFLPA